MRLVHAFFRSAKRIHSLLLKYPQFTQVAVVTSVSALGVLTYSFAKAKTAYALHTLSENVVSSLAGLPEPVRHGAQSTQMQRFLSFASLEFNGEVYMTPVDFIRCAVTFASAPYGARRLLDQRTFDELVRCAPPLSRSCPTFLQDLGLNGVISFSECMFLLSVISHPRTGLLIAFRMFDRDMNDEVDIKEFKKITRIFPQLFTGEAHPLAETETASSTTLLRHLFGKKGTEKLRFQEFSKFIDNLQTELLHIEFDHFATGYSEITPVDLGLSLLRFARIDSKVKKQGLEKLKNDPDLVGKSISFASYKALYDFLYVIDDFSSALRLFQIAKRSISKEEFQRATRAVTGSPLHPLVVDVIFTLFDADGDGHLSSSEFIDCIRGHGLRHLVFNPTDTRKDTFKRCISKQLAD